MTMLLELVPLRFGVLPGDPSALPLLVRITPPSCPPMDRPALNLALALDRSGSMQGDKLRSMLGAARQLILNLQPNDRVSVVLFSSRAQLAIPSTLAHHKGELLRALDMVQADGNTALHQGWKDAAFQALAHQDASRVNRVLLLTDGLANSGETDIGRISQEVGQIARRGLTTTTLGFGGDYKEELLRAMALAGDGNHYYVESPAQLPSIFTLELGGLMATLGQRVRLTLTSPGGLEVLTPLEREEGALRLNDLIVGNPLSVLVKLNRPDLPGPHLEARLSYHDLARQQTVSLSSRLELPVLSQAAWESLTPSLEVRQEMVLLEGAVARDRAADALDRDRPGEALEILMSAIEAVERLPETPLTHFHLSELRQLLHEVRDRKYGDAKKRAYHGSHAYYKGQRR